MPNQNQSFEDVLVHIWGAGIDFATSDDFKDLSDDERDEAYIRYRDAVVSRGIKAHNAELLSLLEGLKAPIQADIEGLDNEADSLYSGGDDEYEDRARAIISQKRGVAVAYRSNIDQAITKVKESTK